jgi:hypothetical protein
LRAWDFPFELGLILRLHRGNRTILPQQHIDRGFAAVESAEGIDGRQAPAYHKYFIAKPCAGMRGLILIA